MKTFAFKLSEKRVNAASGAMKWKARPGVSASGCTVSAFPDEDGEWRADYDVWGQFQGRDKGYNC